MENSGKPLGDGPAPRQRLAALLGEVEADRMMERFHQALRAAIAAIDGGELPSAYGHRIGGLAGMMGFAALSAAWLRLQDVEEVWPAVRAATLEAMDSRIV